MELSDCSDAALQAELERRKRERLKDRVPAFWCHKCGGRGYFVGCFAPHRFEVQAEAFFAKHRDCQPFFNGGGI